MINDGGVSLTPRLVASPALGCRLSCSIDEQLVSHAKDKSTRLIKYTRRQSYMLMHCAAHSISRRTGYVEGKGVMQRYASVAAPFILAVACPRAPMARPRPTALLGGRAVRELRSLGAGAAAPARRTSCGAHVVWGRTAPVHTRQWAAVDMPGHAPAGCPGRAPNIAEVCAQNLDSWCVSRGSPSFWCFRQTEHGSFTGS